jgi:hypothetical protein
MFVIIQCLECFEIMSSELLPLDIWYMVFKFVGTDSQYWVKRVCKLFYTAMRELCKLSNTKVFAKIWTFEQFQDLLLAPYETHINVPIYAISEFIETSDRPNLWKIKSLTDMENMFHSTQKALNSKTKIKELHECKYFNGSDLIVYTFFIEEVFMYLINLQYPRKWYCENAFTAFIYVGGKPMTSILEAYKETLKIIKNSTGMAMGYSYDVLFYSTQHMTKFVNRMNRLEQSS